MLKQLWSIIFGLAFAAIAMGIGLFAATMLVEELTPLKEWPPFDPSTAAVGNSVVAQGVLSASNEPLWGDNIVLGQRERRSDDSWTREEEYTQPLYLDLPTGEQLLVVGASGRVRGNIEVIPQEGRHQVIGVPNGRVWTVTGLVTSTDPPTIAAEYHYVGTKQEWVDMFKWAPYVALGVIGLFVLIGVGISLNGVRLMALGNS
jgi:hypothetical protein